MGSKMCGECNWPTEEQIEIEMESLDEEKFHQISEPLNARIFALFEKIIQETKEEDQEITVKIWMESLLQHFIHSIQHMVHKDSQKIMFARTISRLQDVMNDGMD